MPVASKVAPLPKLSQGFIDTQIPSLLSAMAFGPRFARERLCLPSWTGRCPNLRGVPARRLSSLGTFVGLSSFGKRGCNRQCPSMPNVAHALLLVDSADDQQLPRQ